MSSMRTTLFLASLVLLQGCSVSSALRASQTVGDYSPLTLASVDPENYNKDKQECIKQVQKQVDNNMSVNYNIMKFRECLIQKGYVLLS